MDLIVFMPNGTTYRFQGVKGLEVDTDDEMKMFALEFSYFGVSTQQNRHAKFSGVAGYSYAEREA